MARFAYRIATGHIAVATIQGSSSYLLSNRTRASDQPVNLPWACGLYPVIQDYGVRRMTLGGKYAKEGYSQFIFVIAGMTPGMMDAWDDDFFPSGVESKEFTIQVPDKRLLASAETKVYQCIIHKPAPGSYTFLPGRGIPIAPRVPYEITQASIIT